MKLNVGNLESFIRIFTGICLSYAALRGYIGGWGYLGLVLVATGLSRFCPITSLCGINTNSCNAKEHH